MKLVRVWVRDTQSPDFQAEARRQSLVVARSSQAKSDQEFVDAISILNEE